MSRRICNYSTDVWISRGVSRAGLRGGAADHQLGFEQQLLGRHGAAADLGDQQATAAWPIASMGWRIVVSGGSVQFMKAESS